VVVRTSWWPTSSAPRPEGMPLPMVEDELRKSPDISLFGANREVPGSESRCGPDPGASVWPGMKRLRRRGWSNSLGRTKGRRRVQVHDSEGENSCWCDPAARGYVGWGGITVARGGDMWMGSV
jgi:hypothetical protein